jgi:hypothetical protein
MPISLTSKLTDRSRTTSFWEHNDFKRARASSKGGERLSLAAGRVIPLTIWVPTTFPQSNTNTRHPLDIPIPKFQQPIEHLVQYFLHDFINCRLDANGYEAGRRFGGGPAGAAAAYPMVNSVVALVLSIGTFPSRTTPALFRNILRRRATSVHYRQMNRPAPWQWTGMYSVAPTVSNRRSKYPPYRADGGGIDDTRCSVATRPKRQRVQSSILLKENQYVIGNIQKMAPGLTFFSFSL